MAGFFNTSWDLANMFNLPTVGGDADNPYGFTGGAGGKAITPWYNSTTGQNWDAPSTGYLPPSDQWSQGTAPTLWGAPTDYQAGNMFSNNPYQAGNNQFYNPYQFGQTVSGTQYGGDTSEQPWWMNYNTNSSIVNPPNIPTKSVQPDPSIIPRPGGTGPDGKDLTHAETIKYFGLYDGAENAFAAGDKQAAYRQDHMQWRSGTGAWAGNGKKEGQSDLDYPGRTTDAGDVIMGDREKLGGWSDIGNNLKNYLSLEQMFNITANDQGGNDYTVKNDGMLTLADGTTVETQVMSAEEKAAQDEMLKKQDLELIFRRMEETRNPFDRETNYGYTVPTESTLNTNSVYPYVPSDDGPFNYPSTLNTNQVYPYVPSDDGPFNYPSTLNTNSVYPYVPSDDGPYKNNIFDPYYKQIGPQYGLPTPTYGDNIFNDNNNKLITRTHKSPYEAASWDYGTSGFDSGDSRFKPAGAPRAYDINKARGNNIFEKSINLPSEQLGPYTSGGLSTNKDFFRQVFNQSGGIDPSQENPWFDELAYDAGNLTPDEEAVIKLREDKIRAMAKSKADAEAYERAQVEAAMAKSKADAEAYEAAQAVQEKAKQAKAQEYDTGYVRPNKYVQQYEQLKKAGAPVRRSGNRYGFGL